MKYAEFLRRYGASVRTKNIIQPNEVDPKKVSGNRRPHVLPETTEIPREFIRLDPWEAEYLFILAERAKEGIVETGRFHGGSTFVMACANSEVPIWSIDLAPQDDERLRTLLTEQSLGENVDLIVGDSQFSRYNQIEDFDVLWIDGDHSYDGCMADLKNWYPLLSKGGHVVLHDSYYGQPSMDAIKDFFVTVDVQPMIPAFRPSNHWWHYAGSMAHFIKMEDKSE